MIKVTYFFKDKSTIMDVDYYEDWQAAEAQEDAAEHGNEYTKIENVSADNEEYLSHKAAMEKFRVSLDEAMKLDDAQLEEEMKDLPPHKFSEDFERKMAELFKRIGLRP